MVIKMEPKIWNDKYTAVSPYTEDTDRIRVYATITKMQMCDFIKMLVDDWVEKNPEFKNIPMKREV